ncbi:lipid A-modifier LpxR family protein [Ruegeria lacuscaerulensis]|uniref:lipid A-modifier LpxR family protein n=1 Tax=Ruegeria lacuscaerulensis TaxID=55218 RepID=UPI001480D125|nr:lipid A-modifier LpxR family protein [Ruegeria lacuscaerulensis]
MRALISALGAILTVSTASADTTKSSFFTNDFFGDGQDRWRSASYTLFFGFEGEKTGGVAHDFRARAEIISPWGAKSQPTDDDRPYVGLLGFGVFANDSYGEWQYNAGAEVLFTGEQTHIADFQQGFHDLTGIAGYLPNDMPHEHVGDSVTGMVSAEIARGYVLSDSFYFRPFVGVQAGYETFGRVGVDLLIDGYANAQRYVRDPISGFLQPSSPERASKMNDMSFLLGADYTYVTHSDFFPDWSDVEMTKSRFRARAGVQVRIRKVSTFFGLTYLSKEFESQVESQTIGVLSLEFPF